MKNVTQMFCRAISVLLLVCCLFSIAVPVSAAQADTTPSDTSYGIDIICRYSDVDESDSIDPSIYEKNVFLLSSKDFGLYAVAEYCEETQSYQVVDYTRDKDSATHFRCGMNYDSPGELRITGILEDSYLLTQVGTQDEYILLRNPVEIVLASGSVTVDGRGQRVSTDPNTGEVFVTLSILLCKSFDLPMSKIHPISYWSYQNFGFDILFWGPVAGIIGCTIALIIIIRSSRKKQN